MHRLLSAQSIYSLVCKSLSFAVSACGNAVKCERGAMQCDIRLAEWQDVGKTYQHVEVLKCLCLRINYYVRMQMHAQTQRKHIVNTTHANSHSPRH